MKTYTRKKSKFDQKYYHFRQLIKILHQNNKNKIHSKGQIKQNWNHNKIIW